MIITGIPGDRMHFENKTLECRDCHQPFLFSAGEQEFFALKNLVNIPKRCPNCRIRNKLLKAPCADCGVVTVVPFKPTGKKPILCQSCMHANPRGGSVEDKIMPPVLDPEGPSADL
jgi:CxxC-x17-CxxC domain-containing protein